MASHTNRLAQETSPYLLQHAHNPVDWYPWGREALERAGELDRPILLSSGYSACHWCHVMERESFENEEIAELMNRLFINIKVDREERPDIDSIYMNFVQMSTGHGGWPLTVFLTPEQVPFYGGTYFPPEGYSGRPGFKTVLESVSRFYREHADEISASADELRSRLRQTIHLPGETLSTLTPAFLENACRSLQQQADSRFGGFGSAPKFPAAMALGFLLRCHERFRRTDLLATVELSLTRMAQGGIYDQLGGGFHRYSVDDRWFAPHFEKMLYDNALLTRVYIEAFQVTGGALYRRIAEETLDYMTRDLLSPEGGFFSAEDADSEGEEGRFYAWEKTQIEHLLPAEDVELFCDYFGVSGDGNWEGTNILHRRRDLAAMARQAGASLEELVNRLSRSRRILLEARTERVRPGLDDKVLAAWNGLALNAFATAAFVLSDSRLLRTATRNAEFLSKNMISDGRLFRSWKQGRAKVDGYLEDYAQVIDGLLALYQAGGDSRWFHLAASLTETAVKTFWDDGAGDFYFTADTAAPLLIRPKEHFDNATPSGNSTMALNLLRLFELTGEEDYRKRAVRLLSGIVRGAERYPGAFGNWLQAIDFYVGPVRSVVLAGDPVSRECLEEPLRRSFLPRTVVAYSSKGEEPAIAESKRASESGALAYVCEDFVCQSPVADPEELRRLLTG